MAFLTAELDDPHAAPCGRCDLCAGVWFPTGISADDEAAAKAGVDRVGVELAPRALWPGGLDRLGVTEGRKKLSVKIAPGDRLEPGRVVARLTDLGWGGTLRDLFAPDRDGRPVDAEVPEGLARASLRVLREWDWAERPTSAAWVPSVSRPRLVESLATGIATAGRLRLLGPLELNPTATPLDRSTNSAFRVRDVWSRFRVPPAMTDALAAIPFS